ncbi:hypothetical protein N0V82_001308 [Gnomoniopsis sp. IMI 355080]|nr:hypothetical protein N0V82_001308 [Gnomoniopsis sp. IMI 355080]
MANHEDREVIDLTEEGEAAYDEEVRRIADRIQQEENEERDSTLPGYYGQQPQGRRAPKKQRNAPLHNTHRPVQAYSVDSIEYRINDFFELAQPVGQFWQVQFLEIKQIWVSFTSNEVLLRGLPYARNSSMRGRFERSINEVCQILEIDEDDGRPDEQQAMIEVLPHETLAIREFHKTNTDISSPRNCRYGNDTTWGSMLNMEKEEKTRYKQEFAPLTCRWKMKLQYRNASFRKAGKAFGASAIHLLEDDIHDPAYRIPDDDRRGEWLRRHPSGGRQSWVQREYTYGDAFCGAGGASSGARQGGLKPTIAIDLWESACNSYRRNFPDTVLIRQDIHDFIVSTPVEALPYIDVLHISPPCQHFSPANTHKREDDENEVVLFSCGEIIERIRPRVFTVEQTYGLLAERFTGHFNKLIQCFTRFGYSVQWQERVELIQYGLPQNRKRLIIIGAAPGEQLPPWPAPTHGHGRKPFVTEAMAIGGRFPRDITLHDIQNARQVLRAPRNPHIPLPRTILCTGPQEMVHYSGQRDFTIRELATLNGYPLDHNFIGPSKTAIKKQIGNAFPASVAKVFFESIRKFLERQDRDRHLASASLGLNGHRPQPAASGAPGPRLPEYTRLNGDLDEDEALQIAMRESHRERRHPSRMVITIDDSDEDNDGSLLENMARLSVEPSQSSPPTTGESSRSRQTAWSSLSTPNQPNFGSHRRAPSSAASSVTMANSPSPGPSPSTSPSPSPSPCQQQSRKRKADGQRESARKRVHDTVSLDDEVKIADRARARAAARGPPREEEGRLAFGERSWLGKLPVRRGGEEGWEF